MNAIRSPDEIILNEEDFWLELKVEDWRVLTDVGLI